MRLALVLRYVGLVLVVNAVFMALAYGVAVVGGDDGQVPLLFSAIITALVGLFPVVFVPSSSSLNPKEGYAIVVCSWVAVCFFGMVPYLLWGHAFDFSAAWFESVSGYSTSGATILDDVESLPHSLLLWRSLTHWIGGIGVVVFVMAMHLLYGNARMTLLRTEVSPMARQDFRYRSKVMLRVMVSIYLGVTLVAFGALILTGIPIFDAVNLSFSAVSTGGFAVTNQSIASYQNTGAEVVLIVAMLISSIHFGLLFGLLSGQVKNFFRAPIVRFFLILVLLVSLSVAIDLVVRTDLSAARAFHLSLFHVVSILSTTGFATYDIGTWPSFALFLLLTISFFGACSGSTAGGIKLDRLMIAYGAFRATLRRKQSPSAVVPVHSGGFVVDSQLVSHTLLFIVLYMVTVAVGGLIFSMAGHDMVTSLSVSVASMGNVGLTVGSLGPFDSYGFLGPACRLTSSGLMLLGRLEIFGLLLIFFPSSWK